MLNYCTVGCVSAVLLTPPVNRLRIRRWTVGAAIVNPPSTAQSAPPMPKRINVQAWWELLSTSVPTATTAPEANSNTATHVPAHPIRGCIKSCLEALRASMLQPTSHQNGMLIIGQLTARQA